jgi:acyl carrier protein
MPVTTKDKVLQVVFAGIEEANQVLPREAQLEKSEETALMGELSELDSLGLVNLIAAVEQKIEEEFHVLVNLADDEAMSLKANPFATVGTLTEYIATLLERRRA